MHSCSIMNNPTDESPLATPLKELSVDSIELHCPSLEELAEGGALKFSGYIIY